MKRFTGLSVTALSALILGACSSSYMAHQGEYDDMYYSSADRQRESHKDVSFNTYSNFKEDAEPLKLDGDEDLIVDNYSAKTLNPDYISKYNSELSEDEGTEYGDGDYYAEGYDSAEDEKSTIINNYYGNGYGIPYRYNYRYYDPFYYDPFYWDPFYSRYYYGPGVRVTISYNYGWGYNRWNNWYLYDSYYGYSPSWVYSAMYCSPSGFYYGSYYGGGFYSSYGYTNSIYYNNSYVNINPDNINGNTRKIVKGPRPSRGVVSSLTDENNSRSSVGNIANPSRSRTQGITDNSASQSSYYRRSRQENQIISRDEIDRNSVSRTTPVNINQRSTQSIRTSTNYVRPKTNRSSLYDVSTNQRSSGYQVNPSNNTRQRSSINFNNNRQNSSQQLNRTTPGSNRNYQINRSSTPVRNSAPARSNVAPSRSSTEKSSGTRSGNNSSSSKPGRKN